jgi:DNA mismatch endonuclease (patch repair protein)
MVDVFSAHKRSAIMSRIRSRGNKLTELALLGILRRHKITGWRRNQPVFGKPDFIFPQRRIAVFVDGCFWHCCPKHSTLPASNRTFWMRKLARNQVRDQLVNQTLRNAGWKVIRIWQHDLTQKSEAKTAARINKNLALAGIKRLPKKK